MDPFNQLLDLQQGSLSIEEYVTQFCVISDKVPFDEVVLKDIFCFGLNEPVKSWLPEGKFNVSLKDFIDYALLCAGSSFTVGVAEEEHNTVSVTKMVATPESVHKMAATTTPRHVIAVSKELSQVSVNVRESSQSIVDLKEPSQVTADLNESLHVSVDLLKSSHVSAARPESPQHVSADRPESQGHVSADRPEPQPVTADTPRSSSGNICCLQVSDSGDQLTLMQAYAIERRLEMIQLYLGTDPITCSCFYCFKKSTGLGRNM
ncbi:uncharacterized protein LOC131541301 [Onychostoma macrolepis]|uniref:uncharacterized protein LOC131541301 n=1 Tax=Onychostoma macrolepis TaxID=369639 RepID=UPI002729E204|nr:uncharacterized protein LOC131541301 [Onychostoma macrolepis]